MARRCAVAKREHRLGEWSQKERPRKPGAAGTVIPGSGGGNRTWMSGLLPDQRSRPGCSRVK